MVSWHDSQKVFSTSDFVHDEMHCRQYVRELIKADSRFRVVAVCENGQSAINESQRFQLDAVFLDIHMPGRMGWQWLKHSRETDSLWSSL